MSDRTERKKAPRRYVSRPTEIEALQWTGDNVQELWDVFTAEKVYGPTEEDGNLYILAGPDGVSGWLPVPVGHCGGPVMPAHSRPQTFVRVIQDAWHRIGLGDDEDNDDG